jgi:hypothetical protein
MKSGYNCLGNTRGSMIGKITKGNGFAGVSSYILSKDEARLIGGNMASTTAASPYCKASCHQEVKKTQQWKRALIHLSLQA